MAADSITPPPNDSLGTGGVADGGDSLSTHPLDSLQNTGRDTLPAFDPAKTDSVAAPKPEVKPTPVAKTQGKGLFGQEVGLEKVNDPKDVYALMYRLEEIGFLTVDDWQSFGADKTGWEANGMQGPFPDCAISKIIKRYQAAIGLKVPDEFIAPGKFTEKALLEGKGGNKKEESANPLSPSTQTGHALSPNTPDYECIAKELYEAGQGWGTDEEKIYKNLGLIEAGGEQAKKLKETFCNLYDKDLEQFLKDELWDWGWFNEESKALEMLEGKEMEKIGQETRETDSSGEFKDIGPLLTEGQYYGAIQGEQVVPLSYLKDNMNYHATETGYRESGCYFTCRYTLEQAGFAPQGINTAKYMVEAKFEGEKDAVGFKKWISGVSKEAKVGESMLDKLLNAKIPVIVGVNRDSQNAKWTNTKTDGNLSPTDHFVIVVGRTTLEDGSKAYRYYDSGRYSKAKGTSPQNLLIVNNGYISGNTYCGKYVLSEIRNVKNHESN
ncbi:MAG: hypothetical protein H6581_27945 [Bacteroidia bacterium]|nr:hypothetical protein [Bacteroidia bacterium]